MIGNSTGTLTWAALMLIYMAIEVKSSPPDSQNCAVKGSPADTDTEL